MKLSLSHLVALVSVATAAGALALITWRLPHPMLPEVFHVARQERRVGHELLLLEVRDLYRLHTVEYVHRSVFPYDFMPAHLSINSILRSIRSGSGLIADMLNDEEQRYLDAYNISRSVGLRPDSAAGEFVVVTVVVRAGFDLENTVFARAADARKEDIAAVFRVEELPGPSEATSAAGNTTTRVRHAHVLTPPAVITDVRVEDVGPSRYPYPDVPLDPAGWRRVAEFVREHARTETIADGILARAEQQGAHLLETLLLQTGFDEVHIRTGIVPLSPEAPSSP